MRVTAQSQAILSTALAEIGSENSMFAPAAPGKIVLAGTLGQRLKRGPDSGAADLVEVAIDVDRSFVAVGDLEAARLHTPCFFAGAALGVGRMARAVAIVMKASDGVLAGLPQQRGLIETIAHIRRCARDKGEVGEANLAIGHCRHALVQTRQLLTNADAITGSAAAHVTVGLHPGDGAVEALPVVLIGLSELSGEH